MLLSLKIRGSGAFIVPDPRLSRAPGSKSSSVCSQGFAHCQQWRYYQLHISGQLRPTVSMFYVSVFSPRCSLTTFQNQHAISPGRDPGAQRITLPSLPPTW